MNANNPAQWPRKAAQEIQLLALVRESGGMSRVQLARAMGLHLPALTLLAGRLIKEGLIRQEGQDSSTGGRPSIPLRLNSQHAVFLGVEIGLSSVKTLCVDLSGAVLHRVEHDFESPMTLKELLAILKRQAEAMQKKVSRAKLKGLGLAVAAMVDQARGLVLNLNALQGREEVALEAELARLFPGLPIVLHNDAKAAALAEHWYGGAKKTGDFFWVYLGLGLGMGILSRGEIYQGAHGIAGELGFTCMGEEGAYFTHWASGEALMKKLSESLKQGRKSALSASFSRQAFAAQLGSVKQALAQDDALVREACAETGKRLGSGIAGMVNLFDPSQVFLGGPLLGLGPSLLEPLGKAFEGRLLLPREHFLQHSALGDDAVALGAAALSIRDYLSVARLPKKKPTI